MVYQKQILLNLAANRHKKDKGFDTNFTNLHQFKCAEGATEISPVLARSDYAGSAPTKEFLLPSDGRRWPEAG
jgi:hypothetical protein